MIYIYVITYIIFFVINSYVFNKKMNFMNLIITLWTSISVVSMFGFYSMFVPNKTTYIYILCFIYSFELFSILFNKVLKVKESEKKSEDESNNLVGNKINYKKYNIILIILILIMSIFAIQGIKIICSGGSFSNIRDAYLNHENFSNELQMFISLVIVPLGNAVGIYATINLVQNKKITSTIILYLIFIGENIIYTGGRAIILNIALIMILALMDKYNNNIFKIIKENKFTILTILVSILILGIITFQRNLQGKGILYNIYCYSAGSIHLLGVYVSNPEKYLLTNDNLLYGQILISGFTYPITFILRLMEFNVKAGLYTFYETTQNFVPISSNTTINNSVTIIGYALRDFGFLGIFIYTAIITLIYTYLYKRKKEKNNILNKALYYYFIKCSIFLFSDFQFANTGTIITFIYLILLYKLSCTSSLLIKNEIASKFFKTYQKVLIHLDNYGIIRLSDKKYIKLRYEVVMDKNLNLEKPQTFNEKLQWLKLNDRKDIYTIMVDKYEVKKYVENIIGKEYIIPTLGIYERFDDINFDELPNQFVLKCTHDSGGIVICKDKRNFNKEFAKEKLNKHLKKNYYYAAREWPYKNVKPRIIIEAYMKEEGKDELTDYKLMCFNGKVKCSFVCLNRNSIEGLNVDFYDINWNKMPFERHYPNSKIILEKPQNYDLMIKLAEKLSKNIPFLRVDFYEINNKIYFGELTFYPGAGLEKFRPESWDQTLGEWININV